MKTTTMYKMERPGAINSHITWVLEIKIKSEYQSEYNITPYEVEIPEGYHIEETNGAGLQFFKDGENVATKIGTYFGKPQLIRTDTRDWPMIKVIREISMVPES